uniref:Uncharacterized protein n=1 Tax=Rhizophora mucronata TaxID=61149 RepID=A0A2P2R4M6_RHIMU
MFSHCSTQSA